MLNRLKGEAQGHRLLFTAVCVCVCVCLGWFTGDWCADEGAGTPRAAETGEKILIQKGLCHIARAISALWLWIINAPLLKLLGSVWLREISFIQQGHIKLIKMQFFYYNVFEFSVHQRILINVYHYFLRLQKGGKFPVNFGSIPGFFVVFQEFLGSFWIFTGNFPPLCNPTIEQHNCFQCW